MSNLSKEEIIKILEHWRIAILACDIEGNNRTVNAIERNFRFIQ